MKKNFGYKEDDAFGKKRHFFLRRAQKNDEVWGGIGLYGARWGWGWDKHGRNLMEIRWKFGWNSKSGG